MLLYAVTVFLSAFLLFQVQPIIAKMVLPWFGGSSAVWTTCMLFFQLVLLLGYGYAHWLNGLRARFAQAGVHTVLVLASLAVLPILPNPAWKPTSVEYPVWRLLGLLAVTVGMPYFLLATTSPLLQAWYARSHQGAMPYRLFALSNLASMLALLSYPPLVEPNLPTRAQAVVWSVAYGCFVLLCGVIAWTSARRPVTREMTAAVDDTSPAPSVSLRLLWMGLAACASILLLAVTTFLTQDVAAIPFLWIVPLSVYLLSFIISFESPRLYWRPVYLGLLPVALAITAYRVWSYGAKWHMAPTIWILATALFVFSMTCHGELASMKPHPRHLTGFYLMVALGGALGGLFVGLVAPNIFRGYFEFPIGLGLCAILAVLVLSRRGAIPPERWKRVALLTALAGYLVFVGAIIFRYATGYRVVARNFYGRLAVWDDGNPADDEEAVRKLVHGVINHGEQSLRAEYRRQPITYFCPKTGIGLAMRAGPQGVPRRIGILGLGCGTLAAYGRAGDTIRIYEINPLVLRIAQNEFSYLRDTPAKIEIALGDGRLSLEREASQQFDVLVMDAFSGDSVPVHLITREAFRTYFRHLKPEGILAVNISNRYLDLKPVIERAASDFGKVAMVYEYTPEEDDFLCFGCTWALVIDRATRSRFPSLEAGWALGANPGFREWTDDYSNMLRVLK